MNKKTVIFSRYNKYILVSCKLAILFVYYSHLAYNFRKINIQTIEAAVENKMGRFPNVYTYIYILSKKNLATNFLILYFQK
jgi:hypothetical protein